MQSLPEDLVKSFWTTLGDDPKQIMSIDVYTNAHTFKCWMTLNTPSGPQQTFLGKEAIPPQGGGRALPFPDLGHYMALLTVLIEFGSDPWHQPNTDFIMVTVGKGNDWDGNDGVPKDKLLFKATKYYNRYSSERLYHFDKNEIVLSQPPLSKEEK